LSFEREFGSWHVTLRQAIVAPLQSCKARVRNVYARAVSWLPVSNRQS
jgi:hypothetical protein